MKTVIRIIICLAFVVLQSIPAFSAPMAPMNPITMEGTIEEVSWVPLKTVKGVPEMWGSARHDRTFPAHYKVKLSSVIVPEGTDADYPYYKNGDTVMVELSHKADDGYLKLGMRIKIMDYKMFGDEGGTWTSFKSMEILSQDK